MPNVYGGRPARRIDESYIVSLEDRVEKLEKALRKIRRLDTNGWAEEIASEALSLKRKRGIGPG